MNEFGFKDLYDVVLKSTYPIEIGGRTIDVGEVVAVFDKIQIGNFNEIKEHIPARGGIGNQALVWWEDTKEVRINFSQGVFSKEQLSLLMNGKLTAKEQDSSLLLPYRERLESDGSGVIQIKYLPANNDIFVYNANTYEKISFTREEKNIRIDLPFTETIIDYSFYYNNSFETITIGQPLIEGYLSLSAKTRIKDDTTGHLYTGIINIPKLKLMSKLSMRLGEGAIPILGNLEAIAVPVGNRGQKRIMEFYFLNDDIDSDI